MGRTPALLFAARAPLPAWPLAGRHRAGNRGNGSRSRRLSTLQRRDLTASRVRSIYDPNGAGRAPFAARSPDHVRVARGESFHVAVFELVRRRRLRVRTEAVEYLADRVIFAAPTFTAPYVIEGAPPATGFVYSPWITANL